METENEKRSAESLVKQQKSTDTAINPLVTGEMF
jgi:hypothetical protein